MKTFYEVRWWMYQYNGGGNIKNGYQLCSKRFNLLSEAQCLLNKITIFITKPESKESEAYKDFISSYVWDGYIHRLDGIYKITEEKL